MPRITLVCNSCGKQVSKFFQPNETQSQNCECGGVMTRDWGRIGVGTVVDSEMVSVGQMMLNSGTISGKDKKIF